MTLDEMLQEKKMSKYQLWKKSSVPQATISDICTGKSRIEKCSAETVYQIAKALDVPMEHLVGPAVVNAEAERQRPDFEVFKSNTCHLLKDMGDIPFLIHLLEQDEIRRLYNKKWYPEALYLLAMLDYLSRENQVPLCTRYQDIRASKLSQPLYPASVVILCKALHSEVPKQELLRQAIPEFMRFNIVESEVRNVC